jgi:hypothetical protein
VKFIISGAVDSTYAAPLETTPHSDATQSKSIYRSQKLASGLTEAGSHLAVDRVADARDQELELVIVVHAARLASLPDGLLSGLFSGFGSHFGGQVKL